MFDWISTILETSGALGVALLMFLENVFPPIPSELIMPLAGFLAARRKLSLVVVIISGSVGSLAGATLWYCLGRWMGHERLRKLTLRHGRWLTVSPDELDHAREWFNRYGGPAVLIGRLVPGVRTLISVPAGVTGMRLAPFLAFSSIGTIGWTAALATIGFFLESQYDRIAKWINPISNVIVIALVTWYIYRVATFDHRQRKCTRNIGTSREQ